MAARKTGFRDRKAARNGPSAQVTLKKHKSGSDHYTHVYSSQREQFDTVVPYIQDGLDVGDKCVYVANENTPREVLDALENGGVDVDAAVEAGDLSVVSSHDVFPEGGDADRLLDILESAVQDALEEGYDRVRTTGEMAWLQDHSLDLCVAEAFEDRLNDLAPDYPWLILCQYNRSHFSSAFLDEVLRTHPQFLAGTRASPVPESLAFTRRAAEPALTPRAPATSPRPHPAES